MLIKFNGPSGTTVHPKTCAAVTETSDKVINLGTPDLKEQVTFYARVMKDKFSVPADVFFAAVPINLQLVQDFLTRNSGLAGLRVYFAKKSEDHTAGDYEMIFVPCSLATDTDGSQYFEDMGVKAGAPNAYTMSIECRKPPGCDKGALLL